MNLKSTLDKNIVSKEDRHNIVVKYLEKNKDVSNHELEKIADYLILGDIQRRDAEAKERGDKPQRESILTDNRMVTVTRRETSMEGLTDRLEGGESAFHALIKEDKNVILTPKVSITEEDLEEIPALRQLRNAIELLESRLPHLTGNARSMAKKALIELRKDQYAVKNAFKKPMFATSLGPSSTKISFDGNTGYMGSDGWVEVSSNYFDMWNVKHVSHFIANYAFIKDETWEDLDSDLKWMLMDMEDLIDSALKDEPVLMEILIRKVDKMSNDEIQAILLEKFGVTHSPEYISSLYRNKIPALVVEEAKEKWVDYIYTYHLKGEYKTCTRCKEVKLALNRYFSINRTSSSRFYSICKECRRKVR